MLECHAPPSGLLSPREAARLLRCSLDRLGELRRAGLLKPAARQRRCGFCFTPEEIERFLAQHGAIDQGVFEDDEVEG